MKEKSAERQLDGFIEKYTPEVAALARAAVAKMRARLPGAFLLVYDNYNALAVAFAPTDRTSDVALSVTLYPHWVSLFFRRGAHLPDPQTLLKGSGSTVRHIVLQDAKDLDKPAVRALIDHAVAGSAKPMDRKGAGRTVIKLIAAKKRPRRPGKDEP